MKRAVSCTEAHLSSLQAVGVLKRGSGLSMLGEESQTQPGAVGETRFQIYRSLKLDTVTKLPDGGLGNTECAGQSPRQPLA